MASKNYARRASDPVELKKEHFIEAIIVIKIAVMVGIVAAYFVPQEHAMVIGIGSNLLWLWKT